MEDKRLTPFEGLVGDDIEHAVEAAEVQATLKEIGAHIKYNKMTRQKITTLMSALRLGTSRINACRIARIHPHTLARWMEENPQIQEFIEVAEAHFEQDCLKNMRKAAKDGQWVAAAWLLERTNPGRYGKRSVVHPSLGGGGVKVEILYTDEGDLGVRIESGQSSVALLDQPG